MTTDFCTTRRICQFRDVDEAMALQFFVVVVSVKTKTLKLIFVVVMEVRLLGGRWQANNGVRCLYHAVPIISVVTTV